MSVLPRPLLSRAGLASVLAVVTAGWLAPRAPGCQICIPFPQESAADILLEGEAVVLAREDPDRPFHFAVTEVLKGDPGEAPIDLFLDSMSRRVLAANPERAVVLARRPGGSPDGWRRVGMADGAFAALVRSVLEAGPGWEADPRTRPAFFGSLLGHENRQVNTLAHLEIARAPYDEIKTIAPALPRDEILGFLGNFRMVEWHALYIRLLGLSDEPADHQRIEKAVRSCAEFGSTTQLAAWSTAYIETQGGAALEFLEANYLTDPNRSADELQAVLMALSVHGTRGHVHLRDQIVDAYRRLLERHPELAPRIVGDLEGWKRPDLAGEVGQLLASGAGGFDHGTLLRLRAYARQASPNGGSPGIRPGDQPALSGHRRVLLVALLALAVTAPVMVLLGKRTRPAAGAGKSR